MQSDPHAAFIKVWLGGSLTFATVIVVAVFGYDWPGVVASLLFGTILLLVCFFVIALLSMAPMGALAWATRKLRRQSLILSIAYAALVVSIGLYLHFNSNVREVDVDAMYGSKYGPPAKPGAKEEYFSRQFPTTKEIEDYWFDSTLLVSDPPTQNHVYYFDKTYHRTEWRSTYLNTERWIISPFQEKLKLGSQFRTVTIQCFAVLIGVGNAQRDCVPVDTLDRMIIRHKTGTREYRKGDVFGLSGRKKAPFYLPMKEPITIDSVLAELQRQSPQ